MKTLIELVRPTPETRVVALFSFRDHSNCRRVSGIGRDRERRIGRAEDLFSVLFLAYPRPEEHATPLLPQPGPPQGNRKGTLSFPNAVTLVSQFVRVCFPAETVPCYFSFSSFVLRGAHPKPSEGREGTKRRQKMSPTSQANVNISRGSVL